ncbi:Integral membrane protein [Granulibacter bethesdensis]|uniref:Integral membrane protein n=2 Tax=Granulibacter bethesdensis TaxID=364410 RepID=Q0BVE1_GRABC|nr:Integral membrane protein [Granulibacter bethesdensis CGDNIH1]AHJ67316.1 Integral membrane protein [Granulibacter bethesdensis]APH50993.1 Integral membrane protein [Granulibacter bethesdensis]APH63688.1 Integral membrane protein [Granulibacter bethesdensis]
MDHDAMIIRLCKIIVLALIALWITLTAFGNLTDYGTNWPFVQHVLAMDTIFPDAHIHYRAIQSPLLQHAAYALIIAVEGLAATLCWLGVWRLWHARHTAATFQSAKPIAILGLVSGITLWLGGFLVIGGEWFGMWMSSQWNGIESAFRFTIILMAMLLWLGQHEGTPND